MVKLNYLYITFFISLFAFNSNAQSWHWSQSAGGLEYDEGYTVGVDNAGNSYLGGSFFSSAFTIGPFTLSNSNTSTSNAFLAKYNSTGIVQWALALGSSGFDWILKLDMDSLGSVYATGAFSGSVSIGSYNLISQGATDIFVVKIDSSGGVVWAVSFGGPLDDSGEDIKVAANGNVCLSGLFSSTISVGTSSFTSLGLSDVFMLMLDASGNVVNAKTGGSRINDVAYAISIDPNGDIYMSGYFAGDTIFFNTINLYSNGSTDIFIMKYDGTGNEVWGKSIAGSVSEEIVTDNLGNIYLSGEFQTDTIQIGNDILINAGGAGGIDALITKLDANGNVIWARQMGGENSDMIRCMSIGASGNLFVAGWSATDTLMLGSSVLYVNGFRDALFMEYDTSGNILNANVYGGSDFDNGEAVAADKLGNVFFAGTFSSDSISFGSNINLNPFPGKDDIFLAKLNGMINSTKDIQKDLIIRVNNPVKSELVIFGIHDKCLIKIYDQYGKDVLNCFIDSENSIDVGRLQVGLYHCLIYLPENKIAKIKFEKF